MIVWIEYLLLRYYQGNKQSFEDKWPLMEPVVLKLLGQQSVTKQEWQVGASVVEYLIQTLVYMMETITFLQQF